MFQYSILSKVPSKRVADNKPNSKAITCYIMLYPIWYISSCITLYLNTFILVFHYSFILVFILNTNSYISTVNRYEQQPILFQIETCFYKYRSPKATHILLPILLNHHIVQRSPKQNNFLEVYPFPKAIPPPKV